MPLDFELGLIEITEFGIGREIEERVEFVTIPVDANVQEALRDMASTTWNMMRQAEEPLHYQPSEKYESPEYAVTPLQGDYAGVLRELHAAQMIPSDVDAIKHPEDIFCYFAQFSDATGHRLTALRRASQFKGILKNRLIQLATDALKIVEEKTFKLDNDFDALVAGDLIHILRATGFVLIAGLQNAIQNAVPRNIERIQRQLPFVNFESIESYASQHPRAAKLLASICSEDEGQNVSRERLIQACNECGAEIQIDRDRLRVRAGSELNFLEVLDRRRYRFQLVEGEVETYRAGSRRKV